MLLDDIAREYDISGFVYKFRKIERSKTVDIQRKKGLLDVCVLAILSAGPSYGYVIIGEVSKCIEISESTLYPILKRLEKAESVETYKEEYNGRIRKYYRITESGREKIQVFLDEWEEMKQIYQFIQEASGMEVQ